MISIHGYNLLVTTTYNNLIVFINEYNLQQFNIFNYWLQFTNILHEFVYTILKTYLTE